MGAALTALLSTVSEPIPQPPLDESPPVDAAPIDAVPVGAAPPTRPRRGLLLLVAVVAMLVGAVAATTVVLVVVRSNQHQYAVNVFLSNEATAEQKAAIESALHGLDPVDGVRLEGREQAWQHFQEMFKDRPDMVAQVSADAMPESFRLTTEGREFDCTRLAPIRGLPGVEEIQVIQRPTGKKAGAVVGCG